MSATKKQPNKKQPDKKARTFVKFDSNKKAAYIALLEAGGRRHVSARAVGVTPQTVVNHMHSDPAFAEAVSLSEMEADDGVEDALRMAAISGNVTAALAWLYSRRPERWQDMRRVKVDASAELIATMRALGLTARDVNADPILSNLFAQAGVDIRVMSDANANEHSESDH